MGSLAHSESTASPALAHAAIEARVTVEMQPPYRRANLSLIEDLRGVRVHFAQGVTVVLGVHPEARSPFLTILGTLPGVRVLLIDEAPS